MFVRRVSVSRELDMYMPTARDFIKEGQTNLLRKDRRTARPNRGFKQSWALNLVHENPCLPRGILSLFGVLSICKR